MPTRELLASHRIWLSSLVLASCVLASAAARAEDSPAIASVPDVTMAREVLVAPTLVRPVIVTFPAAAESQEGWVQVEMMVDTTGKPYEVTVVGSSGDKSFEKAALKAASDAQFKSGSLNGQPTESVAQFKVTFREAEGTHRGASALFTSSYSKFTEAVQKKDRPGADAALHDLVVHNLYEDAYFGLAKYQYARQWGSKAEQLQGLIRAIAFEKQSNYLARPEFQNVLVQAFVLELQTHDYAGADATWQSIQRVGADPTTLSKLQPVVEQMHQLRTSDQPFDIRGSTADGSWYISLYKQNFRVTVASGQIHEVKLRCNKGFVRFNFDPELEYKIQPRYGACALELDGDPGTSFTLTQF